MKLELKKSAERFLDTTLPDGQEVRLVISAVTVAQASTDSEKLQSAKLKFEAGEMTIREYISLSLGSLISNWSKVEKKVLESGIEIDHVAAIRDAVIELRNSKEPEQKKTPSGKNIPG